MLRSKSSRALLRRGLLSGVSLSATTLAAAPTWAAGPVALSPAWFAARVDASTPARAAVGSATGTLAQVNAAQQNLATLASRLASVRAVQTQAAAAAAAASVGVSAGAVPDGLVMGGLYRTTPVGSPGWTGASTPSSKVNGATTDVTIQQTAPQASLTWQTFNVGKHTALTFDQSAGGTAASSWVVLNRVLDPSARPSQILGSITAPGKVYVLNANGIVFGAGSQIDLGSLIASTATISAAQFATGIYGAADSMGVIAPSFTGAAPSSAITVETGASIATSSPSSIT